ncbi:ribonuclease H-like domain-containing protein [Tanacetum coccineum]
MGMVRLFPQGVQYPTGSPQQGVHYPQQGVQTLSGPPQGVHLVPGTSQLPVQFTTGVQQQQGGSFPVGDGRFIPVTNSGHSVLSTPFRPLRLNNVLITPNIVKNLISVRQFVRDNSCTVEFDPFGFSVKTSNKQIERVLLRCDSTVNKEETIPFFALLFTMRSLYGLKHGDDTAFLLLFVDDIVLTASSDRLLHQIIASLHRDEMYANGDFWSVLKMVGCLILLGHPVDTDHKLGDGACFVFYEWHDPRSPHFSALNGFCGILAGCPRYRRSTSGYCVFLGNNLLSWSSKRQPTLSRSSAEAEYHGVANAVAETCWIRNLLRELHTPLSSATIVYCIM